MSSSTLVYRRDIDGLRAVAVLPVILFHAGVGAFSGGFVGVDVFFVVSGWLITSIIAAELQDGRFSLLGFYERRARRILPALVLVSLCVLPLAWAWMVPADLARFGQSLVAVATFSANIYFWLKTDYFAPGAEEQPMLHTWSLAVEEQYYLLFPLLLMALWRYGRRPVHAAVWGLALVSLAAAQWGSRADAAANFYLIFGRAWELLAGSLLALHGEPVRRWVQGHGHVAQVAAAAGLAMIIGAIFGFHAGMPLPSLWTLVPVLGTMLVIAAAGPGTMVGRLLAMPPLVIVGLISYSAYLWHQPLFALARLASPENGIPRGGMLFLVALTLVLAWLSWRFVETPLRRRPAPRPRVLGLAAATVVLGCALGAVLHLGGGFAALRSPPQFQAIADSAQYSPRRQACHNTERRVVAPKDSCEFIAGRTRVAVFGDSHAVELAYVLAQQLQPRGLAVKQLSFTGCAPFSPHEVPRNACETWTVQALKDLAASPEIDTVVVTYRIHAHLFGSHEQHWPDLPEEGAEKERVWRGLVATLQALVASGKQVIYVLPAPELRRHVLNLAFQGGIGPDGNVAGVSRDWWRRRTAWVQGRLGDIPGTVSVVDPTNLFCDAESCFAIRAQQALYFDTHHPSLAGAALVAAAVRKKIPAARRD